MTKRHFIALADVISHHNRRAVLNDKFNDVQLGVLADFCRTQNPNFNRERWLGYISGDNGPGGGKVRKPSDLPN